MSCLGTEHVALWGDKGTGVAFWGSTINTSTSRSPSSVPETTASVPSCPHSRWREAQAIGQSTSVKPFATAEE